MVVGISSTFNFKILLLLFFISCSEPWYRSLPKEIQGNSNDLVGLSFIRVNPNRSPMNSSYYLENSSEAIEFLRDSGVEKIYISEEILNQSVKKKKMIGKGKYTQNKNWILIHYVNCTEILEKEGKISEKEKDIDLKILYYFSIQKTVLIPMIYDRGFESFDYGVKDEIVVPYDDEHPYFKKAVEKYQKKERLSHAYFLSSDK